MVRARHIFCFFFFNDTATTEIYTLSLHDALPISSRSNTTARGRWCSARNGVLSAKLTNPRKRRTTFIEGGRVSDFTGLDRKSTRLNSSHQIISYAVFCLKKKT